ncbi:MAG: VanW family protein [Acidimicrobiia bacterium]|nr:VanW family protein [Acidimicrobiia bacterium]
MTNEPTPNITPDPQVAPAADSSSATPRPHSAEARARRARSQARSARRSGHSDAERAWLLVGILCIALVIVATSVVERLTHQGEALPGVSLAGQDVSGKNATELLETARILVAQRDATEFAAIAGKNELSASPSALGATYDPEAAVRASREAGRSNPIGAILTTFLRRGHTDNIALPVSIDDAMLAGVLDGWQRSIGDGLVDGSLIFKGTEVIEVTPKSGTSIVRPEADDAMRAAIITGQTRSVRLPVGETEPVINEAATRLAASKARSLLSSPVTLTIRDATLKLDPSSVASALSVRPRGRELQLVVDPQVLRTSIAQSLVPFETPPKEATFEVEGSKVRVIPSATGTVVDLAPAAKEMSRGSKNVDAPVGEIAPTHDTAWAEGLHINGLVSTYTTNHPCCMARVTNIHTGATALSGAIVEPGETFSLNNRLGQRTLDKGYVVAPAIAADLSYEDAVGGGVSQLSTTLFNAVFFGGYQDITHTVHSLYLSRYPLGREATLNYPSIDNRFKNDTKNGVLIITSFSSTSITVSLYGDNEGRTVRAEGPNIIETIPIEVEYTEDPSLPIGTEKELFPGYIGYVVENFRIIKYADGTEKRQRFRERYQMRKQKVARNLDPAATTTTTTAPLVPLL